jgi:hypothetical protein
LWIVVWATFEGKGIGVGIVGSGGRRGIEYLNDEGRRSGNGGMAVNNGQKDEFELKVYEYYGGNSS